MNVQIPIAGLTLSDGQTYNGQLPVWATRPLMIRIKPDFISGNEYPVYIRVSNGGAIKKEITLPYQETVNLDLSFAAPLLRRADRNKSEGNPAFPQQEVEIWSSNIANKITLPVFHCDETYWDTLGVDGALPQPAKPRIPGQTLDIYFPYRIHPLDALSVEVEPVTGAPSSAIFPTTYVLGNTIDITYIKKLTIKNVWGSGLDQVINYEDRLMSDVIYDESMQCALRARWNMRNGQWFWAAFKDYFWSNKFTAIRGRGGVTEQAELTINLEYGEEWYNVYQELLVSSNVVFDLNIPGINQYQNKRFRAEVVGDTGARWSNSTKTYRQQVRFRTTELTDNYMFPLSPDQPPTPSIQFSAQLNPWDNYPAYRADAWNNIYSNAAWYVESEPSWYAVANGTTLLTPDDFESGGANVIIGATWNEIKNNDVRLVRSKRVYDTMDEVYSVISGMSGYEVFFFYLDSNERLTSYEGRVPMNGRTNSKTSPKIGLLLNRADLANITPAEVSAMNVRWGKRYITFPAGTSYIYGYMLANEGEARTGTLSLRSMAGAVSYPITINQAKVSISLSPTSKQVGNAYQGGVWITAITATTSWDLLSKPSWIDVQPEMGNAGTRDIWANVKANTGAARNGSITFRSRLIASVTQTFTLEQAGATGDITVDTPTFNVDYLTHPVTVNVTSFGNWSVSARDTWITPDLTEGAPGETTVALTIADNDSSNAARTGTITFYNDQTEEIAVVTVNQAGAPTSIGLTPFRISGSRAGGEVRPLTCISGNSWTMGIAPSWVSVSPTSGASGAGTINVTFNTPNPGAARTGELRIKNTVTNEIAICLITQEG